MIGITEICLVSLSGLLIYFIKCVDKNPTPIFGIYEQKNGRYWFKVFMMYWIINLSKVVRVFKGSEPNKFYNFEKPQKLPLGYDKVSDSVTFKGANKNGDHLIVNFGKRHQSVDGYLFLKINNSNLGVLTCPSFPDGNLNKAVEDEYEYSTEGIKLIPLVPMKKWRIFYKGKMIQFDNKTIEYDVKLDGIWISDLPANDFADSDNFNLAKCIAYEKWSKTYFENLKNCQRTSFEQNGILQLKVTVGPNTYDLELNTAKTRATGNNMDDSLYYKACVHQFYTENGDYCRVEQACIPTYGSRISEGFVYISKRKTVYPIKECSFELYKHGGIDACPDDYGFTFKTGYKDYAVQVNVTDSPYIYSGPNWETKTYLKTSVFSINGKPGWGTAQWIYRNVSGKEK